jgi:hypothetical protein
MNITSSHHKFFAYVACVAMLSGCGEAALDQDSFVTAGLPVNNQVAVNGVALNGYLANAIVWIDARENNAPDGFEAFAYTDNQGYFSYNPNTGTNYCQSNEASLQRFCLQTSSQSGDLVIKVAKGIELMTGEPFKSVLTTSVSVSTARTNLENAISLGKRPLGDTSLWQQQLDASQVTLSSLSSIAYYLVKSDQAKLNMRDALNDFGFALSANMTNQDIVNMDYIANAQANNANATSLFMADASLGRIVDAMSLNVNKAAETLDFGVDGLPLSVADEVYKALAANFDQLSSTVGVQRTSQFVQRATLSNKQVLSEDLFKAILGDAITELSVTLFNANLASSAVQSRIDQLRGNTNIAKIANNLVLTAHYLASEFDAQNAFAPDLSTFQQILVLPTLSQPVAYADEEVLLSIMSISELLTSPQGDWVYTLLAGQITNLNSRDNAYDVQFDLSSLGNDIRQIVASNPIVIAALAANNNDSGNDGVDAGLLQTGLSTLANGGPDISITPLATIVNANGTSPWVGKRLSLSGVQDNSEQGQIITYFTQASDTAVSASGELVMCVSYKNLADATDDIQAKRFVGTWSVLGGASQNKMSLVAEGFTIQMNVLGETSGRAILTEEQITSLPRNPNEAYGKFGFTLNDNKATWHSDDPSVNGDFGVKIAQSLPQSDQACKDMLGLGA